MLSNVRWHSHIDTALELARAPGSGSYSTSYRAPEGVLSREGLSVVLQYCKYIVRPSHWISRLCTGVSARPPILKEALSTFSPSLRWML